MKITTKSSINLGSLYSIYEKEFADARRQAKAKHLPMNWDEKFGKEKFKNTFEAVRNSMIDKGLKPSNKEVLNELIDRQRYSVSEKQGKSILKALRRKGLDSDLETVRSYAGLLKELEEDGRLKYLNRNATPIKEFYNEIDLFYKEQRKAGLTAAAAQLLVSQVFFDSQ